MVTSSRIFSGNLKLRFFRQVPYFLRHLCSSTPSFLRPIGLNGDPPLHFTDYRRKYKKPFSSAAVYPDVKLFSSYGATNVDKVFDEMAKSDGSMEENCRYVVEILRSSMKGADAESVKNHHCFALKIGFLEFLPVSSMLLTLYARTEDMSSSLALFGELNVKDVILWNSMITALVQNGRYIAAVGAFVDMIKEGNKFDSTTLLLAASTLADLNCSRQGRSVHSLAIKTGLLSDSSLCNALMKFYTKGGDLNSAELVFTHMEHRDIVSWNTMVTGCLANHHPRKSLEYLKRMFRLGQAVDNMTLSSAISASAGLEELSSGESFHGLAIKSGYSPNVHVSVANSIISLYSKCGDIEAAIIVFDEISCKDVISWNAMLNGFASNEMIWEAFVILREMQVVNSIQPDTVTVVTMVNLCAEMCLSLEGRAIHSYIVRREMQSKALTVTNSLIDMYGKCGLITQAELLFKTAAELDLVSWNSMIFGYAQNECNREAKLLFKELLYASSPSQFSLSTLLAILPSCDSSDSIIFGRSVHCWQLKMGFDDNILSTNSVMNMYISCGDLSAVFLLAETMAETSDVTSWNTIIYGCTSNGYHLESLRMFQVMRDEGRVLHDLVTLLGAISACGNLGLALQGRYLHGLALKTVEDSDTQLQNTLISMYGRCKDIESATRVFGSISEANLCSWNSMISALAQNKAGREAFELFRDIGFDPNEITIVSLLSASTHLGFGSYGIQIHSYLIRRGFQENPFVSAALQDMYSNCGKLETCVKVFKNSKMKSLAAWNSVISAYGFHGNGEKAIELFSEVTNSGIKPNKSTFISLLSACSHNGLVKEGLRYYNQMEEKFEVKPVIEHQVCVVDMLGRAGRLREAYEFVKGIGEEAQQAGVWGALLSACNYHGEMDLGKEVGEALFEMEPENASYYVSLSNAYAGAGRWGEAVRLRRLVEERALQKLPGRSVVDIAFG